MNRKFEDNNPNRYVGHWCLWRKSYETEYKKIFVSAIADGIMTYHTLKYDNTFIPPSGYAVNGRKSSHMTITDVHYCDVDHFENCDFIISPFESQHLSEVKIS